MNTPKEYHENLARVAGGVRSFFEKTFASVEIVRPPMEQAEIDQGPIMIVCTHRSQADYFIIGNYLYHFGIGNLRFAAGDNLTELPYLGRRFKSWGAFPVKRDSARNRAYIMGLCEDVARMMEDGDNIIVFPEGGRSYKGNMMDINQVVIGAAVVAQARNPGLPVRLLPCAISYEQLPELHAFQVLNKGKKLRAPENPFLTRMHGTLLYFGADLVAFAKFLQARHFGIRYGSLYIDMDKLLPISDLVDLKAGYNPDAPNEFWAHRKVIKSVSAIVHQRFLALYRLLPLHAMALAIKKRGAIDKTGYIGDIEQTVAELRAQGRNLRSFDSLGPAQVIDKGLEQLRVMKAVSLNGGAVTVTRPEIIDYYAASIE
jgi:1-acyl-sn-glycerol-3-phosphate acyltransferase